MVDAYSDYRASLPQGIAAAERDIRLRGRLTRWSGDHGMGVPLDPSKDEDWALIAAYSPWAIHAELTRPGGDDLATIDDAADSIALSLTNLELADLTPLVRTLNHMELISRPARLARGWRRS